jgi:PAB-dependent poly(A)-specific ribonuclease subunit 2
LTSGKFIEKNLFKKKETQLNAISFYNKTPYSGLEIHIANSYANSLLQLMHFTPIMRNIALQHAATACLNDTCLLCEMGFLFDMLQKAEGSICQATNLLKTLSNLPQGMEMEIQCTPSNRGLSQRKSECINN